MKKVYQKAQGDFKAGLKTEGYSDRAIDLYAGGHDAAAVNGGKALNFDVDGALQHLAAHPDTLPDFLATLKELDIDPEDIGFNPADYAPATAAK
jgi:hypothetical protein